MRFIACWTAHRVADGPDSDSVVNVMESFDDGLPRTNSFGGVSRTGDFQTNISKIARWRARPADTALRHRQRRPNHADYFAFLTISSTNSAAWALPTDADGTVTIADISHSWAACRASVPVGPARDSPARASRNTSALMPAIQPSGHGDSHVLRARGV